MNSGQYNLYTLNSDDASFWKVFQDESHLL